ncbi:asparagine synthase-related protein [Novosphingobium lindaniclasticum]
MTGHRYLIVASPGRMAAEAQIDEIARLSGLPYRAGDGQLIILTDQPEALRKVDGGFVVGTLFHRYGSPRPIDVGEHVDLGSAPITCLLERFWGSYLAAFAHDDEVTVLRDPSGAAPAHYAPLGDSILVASEAGLLRKVGAINGKIDYEALARHIYLADLPMTDAPLAGARRLSPGTALKATAGTLRIDTFWNPWTFAAKADPTRNLEEHALALSRCAEGCIRAWANCFPSILVGVSGGLDSSIVTACLAGRDQVVTGLTMVAPGPAGDERGYARALCDHLDVRLLEEFYALGDVDPLKSCVPHLSFPSGRTQSQAYNAAVGRAMRESGAAAFFTGNGGDNVFFLSQSTRGLIDRRRSGASVGETWQSLRDVCALTGSSMWAAFRQAYRISGLPARYAWRPDPRFLSAATIERFADLPAKHPWLDAPAGALPGKSAHIGMILRIQNHAEGFDPSLGIRVINPLLSQPILEQCLATPTWLCSSGGRDRAVARHAFSARLPEAIAERRVKGGPDGFAAAILEAHIPQIRTRLLSGRLAEAGIIDLAAVEMATRPGAADRGSSFVPLLFFLDIEGWIEHWTTREMCPNSKTPASATIAECPANSDARSSPHRHGL